MSRSVAWRRRAPVGFEGLVEEAQEARYLLVDTPGPTSFVLQPPPPAPPPVSSQEGGGEGERGPHSHVLAPSRRRKSKVVKVLLGDGHQCSCSRHVRARRKKGTAAEHCVHIVYVLIRLCGVGERDPLLWQLALTQPELAGLLSRRAGGGGEEW